MTHREEPQALAAIDFRSAAFLKYDRNQTPDTSFIEEVRAAFKVSDNITEELVGLSDLTCIYEGNSYYLDICGDRYLFPENGLAFVQYCTMLGIPFALAKKNPPELNITLFSTHTGLKTQVAEKEVVLKYWYNTATEQNELSAVLRGTFQTIRNSMIFDSFVDALGDHLVVDRDMCSIDPFGQCYLRILSPNFLPSSDDDKIFMAYDLQFSECVDTGITLGLGLWRQVCSNGLAIPSPDGFEAYKHPYKGLDPTVPAYVFSRLLHEVVANDAVGKRLASRRDELMLEQMDLQTTLERLAYHGTPNAFISTIEDKVAQDPARSQWDLMNDLTEEVQSITNLRRRRAVEKCIGHTFGFTLSYDSPHTRKKKKDTEEAEQED